MTMFRSLYCIILTALFLSAGCYMTMEQRWEAFDAERRQEIGVKTKDYYLNTWGKPSNRTKTAGGEEVWTWEQKPYGGAQGWRKTLVFTQDGVLKDFRRDYWPKESG